MATAGLAQPETKEAPRAPRPIVLWAIALAGCAAAGVSLALTLTSDHRTDPGRSA